ncbi:MAG: hypothetical protein KatS3mg030_487 [Saprospiraceae bacterium]|nr:MAG: hypothetical protein KatS3mg030_487 [Saprospiraceae bacterium]
MVIALVAGGWWLVAYVKHISLFHGKKNFGGCLHLKGNEDRTVSEKMNQGNEMK